MGLLLSYYGDDFTGSTDVMESMSLHGVKTVLFTRIPTSEEVARFSGYDAIGIAGTGRSQTPAWMDAHLPQHFEWLNSLGATFCHYKVCSTFDSAPKVGNTAMRSTAPWPPKLITVCAAVSNSANIRVASASITRPASDSVSRCRAR